ncbi:MAG: Ig-like domain-containing protein [Pseudomonadota bacterium]
MLAALLDDVPRDPDNNRPVAANDAAITAEDAPIAITVLQNDVDPDGDTLEVVSVTQGDHGSVGVNLDGTITYSPDPNFSGFDDFRYTVSEGRGGFDSATLTVTVTADGNGGTAPDFDVNGSSAGETIKGGGSADSANGRGGADRVIGRSGDDTLAGGAGSDTVEGGADNDTLVYVAGDNSGATGFYTGMSGVDTLQLYLTQDEFAEPGVASEVAALESFLAANYNPTTNGGPTFTLTALGRSVRAVENIQVFLLSSGDGGDTPTAMDDSYSGPEDQSMSGNVLDNDSAASGGVPAARLLTDPSHWSVVPNESGTFTFAPDADYFGTDCFVYEAVDGGNSDAATVSLTVTPVQDEPRATDDAASAIQGLPIVIDVLANDTDPDGDDLTISDVTDPSNGSVEILPDGSGVTYTPAPGFEGEDAFTYTASDGAGGPDAASVVVSVSASGSGGAVPDFDVNGSEAGETVKGGGNADAINGRGGADVIVGRGGADTLAGVAGSDEVQAGAGDDVLVFVVGDNAGASDLYRGMVGFDTLEIYLTAAEFAAPGVADQIAAFELFAAANYDEDTDGGPTFTFNAWDLNVRSVEALDVILIYPGVAAQSRRRGAGAPVLQSSNLRA